MRGIGCIIAMVTTIMLSFSLKEVVQLVNCHKLQEHVYYIFAFSKQMLMSIVYWIKYVW